MKNKSLIVTKDYGHGVAVQKYHKKVFWENLWHTDPELLECRGKVLLHGKPIALPFKKIFNHKENNTDCELDKEVIAVEKVNGFMFHVTFTNEVSTSIALQSALGNENISYHVFGTTGSLNSDFVVMGKEALVQHNVKYELIGSVESKLGYVNPHTYIFEIKDNIKDPHIIFDEDDGVYLLGVRDIITGNLLSQSEVDFLAEQINAKRPKWKVTKFKDLLEEVKTVKHEGFVIYDLESNDGIMKIKSPFYTVKKWMMRRNNDFVFRANYKQLVDEEYYEVISKIRKNYTEDEWSAFDEMKKGEIFEGLLYG